MDNRIQKTTAKLELLKALESFTRLHKDADKEDSFVLNAMMLQDAYRCEKINKDLSDFAEIIIYKNNMNLFEDEKHDDMLDKYNHLIKNK